MQTTSRLSRTEFLARYGDVFEHSPWIAGEVWDKGLDRNTVVSGLHRGFGQVIRQATPAKQLALLNAHPELAVAVQAPQELTAASRSEQRGAGLDRCTPEEFEQFRRLNSAYREKFGFPFILAVKGYERGQILEIMKSRLANTREEEFQAALEQVILIGKYRIHQKFEEPV